tara:strand:+ start:7227 stop:7352 length:126 start_codon:yes stop_codon:yes gene_type:complete
MNGWHRSMSSNISPRLNVKFNFRHLQRFDYCRFGIRRIGRI